MEVDPLRIVVSHDWPTGITDYGDTETLLRVKDRTGRLRREEGVEGQYRYDATGDQSRGVGQCSLDGVDAQTKA